MSVAEFHVRAAGGGACWVLSRRQQASQCD
jgi:hypothetical protein